MIHGYFSPDANLPYIRLGLVFAGRIVQSDFVIDTGFSGDLKIDRQTARELGVLATYETRFVNANGEIVFVEFVQGYAEMENKRVPIRIVIVNGPQLAGMGLFSASGYDVIVSGKNRTARLERVA